MGRALPGSSMRTVTSEVSLRDGRETMLTPPGGWLRKPRRTEVIPISGPDRAFVAPRELGDLPWAGDSGRVLGSNSCASPHYRGQASDHTYRFVTHTAEPWRRGSRHHRYGEHEGSVTACSGSGTEPPGASARPGFPCWSARPGTRESFRIRRSRCRWVRQEMGG
jgi:hypothetical protein